MKKLFIIVSLFGSFSLYGAARGYESYNYEGEDTLLRLAIAQSLEEFQAGIDAAIATSTAEDDELQQALALSLQIDGHPQPEHGAVTPLPETGDNEIITGDCIFCGDEEVQVFAPCKNCKTIHSCQECLSGATMSGECTVCHKKDTFKPIPPTFQEQADQDLPFTQIMELERKIQLERLNIIEGQIQETVNLLKEMAAEAHRLPPTDNQLDEATAAARATRQQWHNVMHTLALYRHHTRGNAHGVQESLDAIDIDQQRNAETIAKNHDLIVILLEIIGGALALQEGHPDEIVPRLTDLTQ